MNEQDLTPWFVDDVTPARKGVYRTRTSWGFTGFSKWDGEKWWDTEQTAEDAAETKHVGALRKDWRGLAQKPKAKP